VRKDSGTILLIPHGVEPPELNTTPQRPGEPTDGDNGEDESED